MDNLTEEQRRRNMQAIKSSGTKIEIKLAKALWNNDFHYRKNNIKVYGKPDFTFKKYSIAIFVDGEFWHGKDWEQRKNDHKSNQEFWHKKIQRNIIRDKDVNLRLKKEGWKVLRFWGREVEKNLEMCVKKIERKIKDAKS